MRIPPARVPGGGSDTADEIDSLVSLGATALPRQKEIPPAVLGVDGKGALEPAEGLSPSRLQVRSSQVTLSQNLELITFCPTMQFSFNR